MNTIRITLLASAMALLALPASAQDYRTYDGPPAYGPTEEVVIQASREYRRERSTIGAPIQDVALQRGVRVDDLDLTTDWGANRLHERVAYTARTLCRELDARYPVTVSDGPSCYRAAMDDAMAQADDAIARARGE